jgi:hypothetical protein
VKSYDFFDTLCGRGCGEPWRLFEAVGGAAYVPVRQEAERRSDKTWAGIFRSLRDLTRWPQARIDELAAAEWEAELAGAFPIAENVSALRPGDRIVSDTYFGEDQVRALAERIGVPAGVELVVSWDDKHTGKWWKTAAAREAEIHVGDNPQSDVARPLRMGLAARKYSEQVCEYEAEWTRAGLWEVAAAARAARLQNPHEPGTAEAALWDGAARAGVPFLLTAAALVREYVNAARPERVYFVSRDAILLGHAYHKLYGETVGVFHASRSTLARPSESFVNYVRRLAPGTLFVDLHGTGKSVREFEKRTGVELSYVFVCGQRRLELHAPSLVTLPAIGVGTAVEVMNYHHEGRVIDVVGDRPVRAELEYDGAAVAVHQAAIMSGVRACCRPPQGVTVGHVAQAADFVKRMVPAALLRQHQAHHASG